MLPFPQGHWHLPRNPSGLPASEHTCSKEFHGGILCPVQQLFCPLILSVIPSVPLDCSLLSQMQINLEFLTSSLRFVYFLCSYHPPLACLLPGVRNSGAASLPQEPPQRQGSSLRIPATPRKPRALFHTSGSGWMQLNSARLTGQQCCLCIASSPRDRL